MTFAAVDRGDEGKVHRSPFVGGRGGLAVGVAAPGSRRRGGRRRSGGDRCHGCGPPNCRAVRTWSSGADGRPPRNHVADVDREAVDLARKPPRVCRIVKIIFMSQQSEPGRMTGFAPPRRSRCGCCGRASHEWRPPGRRWWRRSSARSCGAGRRSHLLVDAGEEGAEAVARIERRPSFSGIGGGPAP